MTRRLILLLILLLPLTAVAAGLQLPSVIADNMVLQRNTTVRLWGKAAPGAEVAIAASWSAQPMQTKATPQGDWRIELPTTEAGGGHTLTITSGSERRTLKNILLGEVWICAGQSNMSMPVRGFGSQPIDHSLETIVAAGRYSDIRMFTADRTTAREEAFDVRGSWMTANPDTAGSMSAVGYFYACFLRDALGVPIGMINLSWGGSSAQAWSSRELLSLYPEIDLAKIDWQSKSPQRIPTALYNGMFCPVAGYGVRGVIWYQGENNVREPKLYESLFPAMVKHWREKIGRGDIPFYFVQIGPYEYDGADQTAAARLREVQSRCRYLIPNSGMAVTADLGELKQIHFADKRTVGLRLAALALNSTYGMSKVPCHGPTLRRKEVDGNCLLLLFDQAESGLMLRQAEGTSFEVAGADGKFFPAQAAVDPKNTRQLRVWSEQVAAPAEVRYCYRNFSIGTLYDAYALPAAPFRTDTFE